MIGSPGAQVALARHASGRRSKRYIRLDGIAECAGDLWSRHLCRLAGLDNAPRAQSLCATAVACLPGPTGRTQVVTRRTRGSGSNGSTMAAASAYQDIYAPGNEGKQEAKHGVVEDRCRLGPRSLHRR